jgi:hypothetical protein
LRDHLVDGDAVAPRCLDEKSGFEWRQLSAQVQARRRRGACSGANVTLEAAIEREPQSPVAGAYRLWIADNVRHDGEQAAVLALYDAAIEAFQANEPLVRSIDWIGGALLKKAQGAALAGDLATAVETWQALARHDPANANPLFQAGLLMEKAGDRDRAAQFYKAIANKTVTRKADDPADLARRGLERLSAPDTAFLPTAEQVAWFAAFQVEQLAPFSTLSSVFNAQESINSGFAVDAWRPNPFFTANDLATGSPVADLFAGIQADLAVRDSDAFLYRVGYHITLVGRIIFSPVVIL